MNLFTLSKSTNRRLLRRLAFEWLLTLLVTACLLSWLSGTRSLQLANAFVYDRTLSLHEHATDPDIVMITVDEGSLEQLGRWPWRRTVHADFLHKLSQAQPRGVLFDVIFTEPAEQPADDKALAKAITETPNLVIPSLLFPSSAPSDNSHRLTQLKPIFNNVATGQIAVSADFDGVVRRTRLRYEQDGATFDALGLKLLMLGESPTSQALIEQRVQHIQNQGDGQYRLPLNPSKAGYVTLPYNSIINSEVAPEFLKDKYVLVGVTALGLGDRFLTPTSGVDGSVSGIEIHASLVDGLKNGLIIQTIDSWYLLILPIVFMMAGFLWVKERWHLWLFLGTLITFLTLVLALMWWYVWIPPVLTGLGLLWTYLLWSWRRLALLVNNAEEQWQEVSSSVSGLLPLLSENQHTRFTPYALDLIMSYTDRLHGMVTDSLLHFPSAMLIVDSQAIVRLYNQETQAIVSRLNSTYTLSPNSHLKQILSQLDEQTLHWPEWQNLTNLSSLEGRELSGRAGVFAIHIVGISKTDLSQQDAWLVNLVELTSERHAQQERSNLMKFLSHDLRTPQVSILSILDAYPNELATMRDAISHQVHRTLDWANDMVELIQAQNDELKITDVNLGILAQEAIDDVYFFAHSKHSTIELNEIGDELYEQLWTHVDAKLIRRAIMNLLTNAVRYSPEASQITVTLSATDQHLMLAVNDQGAGLSTEQIESLLSYAPITSLSKATDAAGSLGVGLNSVKTIMQRHSGELKIESKMGVGSSFILVLPI